MKRTACAVIVVAIALVAAACGGGDEAGSGNEDVIATLVEQGAPEDLASCFADELAQYSSADIKAYFAAETESDVPEGMVDAFRSAESVCVVATSAEVADVDAPSGGGDFALGAVALPGQEEVGSPLDTPIPFDIGEPSGFGTVNFGCSSSFGGATGLPVRIADCTQVSSALGHYVVVIATLDGANGEAAQEAWLACRSDQPGGYVPVLRWTGTIAGITPMEDPTIGAGIIISMNDATGTPHHIVLRDENAASSCPTSTVETPGAPGAGPVPQANGVFVPRLNGDGENIGVCYRPEGDAWTRGDAVNGAC